MKTIEFTSRKTYLNLRANKSFFILQKERWRYDLKEKHELAYEDYKNGMKQKDIAEKYGTTVNTVKSWSKRYGWSKKSAHQNKGVHTKKGATKIAEKIIESNEELSEEQQLFCIYFLKYHNQVKAYLKIKPSTSYASACVMASRWRHDIKIANEINRLKKELYADALLEPQDIVQMYIDIARADMTDFADFSGDIVSLKNSKNVDGTLIQEIKQGKDGVSIKLADRMKAIDWLSKHMNMATQEQQAKINLLKAQAAKITDEEPTTTEDDGFMEALNDSANKDWDDYEEDTSDI